MKATLSCSSMVEGLRPLVGDNGWDYCILWRLSQDQRLLEWVGCCCCGTEASIENGTGLFSGGTSASVQKLSPCRDIMFQHPRTRACDALSDFPSSIPLDSSLGIYAQVLMSNQPTWQTIHEAVGAKTRVLVPVPGGLAELFVSKQVVEDQHVVDFIMSQCNGTSYEQATADFLEESCDYTSNNNNSWISSQQMMPTDHQNFHWDPAVVDQSQLYASPLNLFDGSMGGQPQIDSTIDNSAYQQSILTGQCLQQSGVGDSSVVGQDKESVKHETGRADSGSEGSEDDDEPRQVGRNGKRHHSKNLVAERNRRKKLNDRLYALRALVPKITKMDRASILGDAIEYVMELQKQVKDLQDELENDSTNPEEGEAKQVECNYEMETTNPNGMVSAAHGMELDESRNSTSATRNAKPANEQSNNEEKGNQMEPQVEVRQLEANEFYLKIFCEHKVGGFARLMEAISSLGLEVTNATVTTLQTLVLNVFNVQKKDNEMVQVDQVRDSLLELTRGPIGGWSEPGHTATSGGYYQHDGHHHQRNHQHHHLSSQHHLHCLHQQP